NENMYENGCDEVMVVSEEGGSGEKTKSVDLNRCSPLLDSPLNMASNVACAGENASVAREEDSPLFSPQNSERKYDEND
ncbi:hypothetical protein GN156_38185, partial [bacterium LRH843]|nr:hypothetical protein [bacterium LRH843]